MIPVGRLSKYRLLPLTISLHVAVYGQRGAWRQDDAVNTRPTDTAVIQRCTVGLTERHVQSIWEREREREWHQSDQNVDPPPLPSLATGEPGGRMSRMPSNGGILTTLTVQPLLRLRRCTVADRLRSCVCSSNSSEACTWSSVSASACRASRERSRWSNVEFRPALCSLWQEREGGIREVWKCDRLTVLTSDKRPTPAESESRRDLERGRTQFCALPSKAACG